MFEDGDRVIFKAPEKWETKYEGKTGVIENHNYQFGGVLVYFVILDGGKMVLVPESAQCCMQKYVGGQDGR